MLKYNLYRQIVGVFTEGKIMHPKTSLNLEDAIELASEISQRAEEDGGRPVAICVVNAAGIVVIAYTMDGTKGPSVDFARAKAVTAIHFERDTVEFHHEDDPSEGWCHNDMGWSDLDVATAIRHFPDFCSWAGGVLVRSPHDGQILGAVGVSNREELEDHELASVRPSGWSA